MTSATSVLADPLADAYRIVRRLTPPEAPFLGTLARAGDDAVQLIDADRLRDWPGWVHRGAHVFAPLDVARRHGGHDVVLPWCVERLGEFIRRRSGAGAPLSPGEIVTVAVSVVRGLRALRPARGGVAPAGTWWLTDDGCPVFVCAVPPPASASSSAAASEETGTDHADATTASAAILEQLRDTTGSTVVERALDRCADAMIGADMLDDIEAALFGLAAPEPLTLQVLTPQRAPSMSARAARIDTETILEPEPRRGGLVDRVRTMLARHIDGDIAELVSDAVHRTRRRVAGSRRRASPWLVATGIAALVIVGGLWWPSGGTPAGADAASSTDAAASTDEADHQASESVDDVTEPAPSPGPAPEAGVDPAGVTAADGSPAVDASPAGLEGRLSTLLDRRVECLTADDDGCLGALFEDPLRTTVPVGPVDLPAQARTVTLLDDLGGVAVLRVDGTGAGSGSASGAADAGSTQIVVLVDTAAGWVIRDVRDITPAA